MKAIFKYNHRQLRQHVMDQNFACLGSRSSGGGAGAFDVSPVPPAPRTGRTGRLGHVCPLRKKWTWGLLQVLEVRSTDSVLNQAVGRGEEGANRVEAAPLSDPICCLLYVFWSMIIVYFLFFFQNIKTNVMGAWFMQSVWFMIVSFAAALIRLLSGTLPA